MNNINTFNLVEVVRSASPPIESYWEERKSNKKNQRLTFDKSLHGDMDTYAKNNLGYLIREIHVSLTLFANRMGFKDCF